MKPVFKQSVPDSVLIKHSQTPYNPLETGNTIYNVDTDPTLLLIVILILSVNWEANVSEILKKYFQGTASGE